MLPPAGSSMPLLLSGTAAIVGHQSLHADSVETQLDETLANLRVSKEGLTQAEALNRLSDPKAARRKAAAEGMACRRDIQRRCRIHHIVKVKGHCRLRAVGGAEADAVAVCHVITAAYQLVSTAI